MLRFFFFVTRIFLHFLKLYLNVRVVLVLQILQTKEVFFEILSGPNFFPTAKFFGQISLKIVKNQQSDLKGKKCEMVFALVETHFWR